MDGRRDDDKEGIPLPPSKPKIWSMAELAVCKTPPPPGSAAWQQMAAANGSGAATSMNGGYGDSGMVDASMGGVRGSPISAASAAAHHRSQQPQHAGMYTLAGGNGGMSHPHNNLSYTTPEKVGRTDLQADTPPQTPPNNNKLLPLNSHQQPMSMGGGGGSHMGQGQMHGLGGAAANNVINPVTGMAESLSRYQHHPYGGYHSHHSPLDAADGGMSGSAGYHADHSHQQYDSLAAITAEDCYNS